ncbi:MAG TPA: hypothetical protein VJQ57_13870 [Acidimicrobiia bacterium]|nr:hypothetical protein [Acidimicrobiia bacterium]
MSKPIQVREDLKAVCFAAGLDPNSVAGMVVTPEAVTFEVYMEPKQQGADGPLTVFVTHPIE